MSKLTREEFRALRTRAEHDLAQSREVPSILICAGTGCIAGGAMKIYDNFKSECEARGLKVYVGLKHDTDEEKSLHVKMSGCHGFCEMGPLVHIEPMGVMYIHVKPEDCHEILEKTVLGGEVIDRLVYHLDGTAYPKQEDIPFYKKQHRVVLGNCGTADAEDIEEYIAKGGYSAFEKALFEMTDEQICRDILDSGLRGRGGGGFPAGRKWDGARKQKSAKKYIVCNGDEGDPGAFMDRSVMEGNPHSVLEGMMIAGLAVGSDEGYIYVRAEYPLAVNRLKTAIARAEEMGLLGTNILGSDFNFRIHVNKGAGAFVCGEGSALTASIEGNRGMPRVKPPRTIEHGLWAEPTVLNNVETFANVPLIIKNGVEWYHSIGTEKSPGTKAFALTGNVVNTGLIEVPMGTTIREVVFDIGGGIPDGKKFKAHVPAGVKDGQKIKLAGKGKLGINGGKAGDLYLHVTVKPDATFSMRGHDIVMDLPVTVGQAVAGGKVEAKDIDGNPVTFKVPAGSSSGAEVKLTGLGVQRSNQPGDLIGRVQIMVPAKPGLAVKHAAKEFDEKAGDYLSL